MPKSCQLGFIWEITEDGGQECGVSGSSEDGSKEEREEPGYTVLVEKIKTTLVEHQKIAANHKTRISQVNNFSAFLRKGRGRSRLIAITPLMCTFTICGQYPVYLHPEFPSGRTVRRLQ